MISYQSFVRLAQLLSLDERELAKAIRIAPETLGRRAVLGRFATGKSDTIYRLALIFSVACDLFDGDFNAARRWLTTPAKELGYERPIDMAITSAHMTDTLELIGRLEHGVAT